MTRPSTSAVNGSIQLRPDADRVYVALFMPGEEMPNDHSRATAVIDRVLALAPDDVDVTVAELHARFPTLEPTFRRHFETVAHRLGSRQKPNRDRQLLIGAYFSHDVSPEGAALTNPSMVAHPHQTDVEPDELRFVMSARAIGEGHVSSVEFRTGVVDRAGQVSVDPLSDRLQTPERIHTKHRKAAFWTLMQDAGVGGETASMVLDCLPATFGPGALEDAIGALDPQLLSRHASRAAIERLRAIADNNYTVAFSADDALSERILIPTSPVEAVGIEDARFVRFTEDDGAVSYAATYTAYDGRHLFPQILRTDDFTTFTAHQLCGPAAQNKGMALFPRRIGGRLACLSRWDREATFVAWSDDGVEWASAEAVHRPTTPWELIQVGNCGSPIETERGWLVLTHGVGPMRTYSIGALLLDLDDPRRVTATLPGPLISPVGEERSGYVPNVVYTCGGLVHRNMLVVPYGVGDQSITVKVFDLPELLGQFRPTGR